jgi:hypothetical protein
MRIIFQIADRVQQNPAAQIEIHSPKELRELGDEHKKLRYGRSTAAMSGPDHQC